MRSKLRHKLRAVYSVPSTHPLETHMRAIIKFVINFTICVLLLKFASALAVTFVITWVLWTLVDAYITSPAVRAADAVLRAKQQAAQR